MRTGLTKKQKTTMIYPSEHLHMEKVRTASQSALFMS